MKEGFFDDPVANGLMAIMAFCFAMAAYCMYAQIFGTKTYLSNSEFRQKCEENSGEVFEGRDFRRCIKKDSVIELHK